jgi:hypothetical protein
MAEPIETREVGADDELASGLLPGLASGGSSPAPPAPALPAVVESHTYRPELVLEPAQARGLVRQIQEMQRSVLVKGTDYDVIPGTGNKPSLLKPGAERLMQVFGLGHEMVRGEVDPDPNGGHWGVWYTCKVTKVLLDGREITVSSCEGYASYDEDKFWDSKWEGPRGNRVKVGTKKSPWNTVIKMAQKRALVGACLTATATSGLFTQDVDEYREPVEPAPRQQSRSRQARDSSSDAPPPSLSADQRKKMHATFNELGITEREARLKWSGEVIGRPVESSNDLTVAEASQVIEALVAEQDRRGKQEDT